MAAKTVSSRVHASKPARVVAPKPATAALSKLDRMIAAMRAPKGASVYDLMQITGWQMHSVRGAIAGALKKKRGLSISSKKIGDTRLYRIEGKA